MSGFLRQRILNLLARGDWVLLGDLVDGCYCGVKNEPINPENVIQVTIRKLRLAGFNVERATVYRLGQ